jgi:hypothetical protein
VELTICTRVLTWRWGRALIRCIHRSELPWSISRDKCTVLVVILRGVLLMTEFLVISIMSSIMDCSTVASSREDLRCRRA